MGDKLRFGMVGGGEGAFIGRVHRCAAELDSRAELVCGAFASEPARSIRSGLAYGLPEQRCYADYQSLLQGEQQLPSHQRMQFVVVVTPNHMHFPVVQAALQAGFHVVCDKPITMTLEEAKSLQNLLNGSDRQLMLTHNYTGYPMILEARELVRRGELGALRRVDCEYLQGWLATDDENKQSSWRTDPKRSGLAGCFGDIGSHAHNLLEFVTGEQVSSVCADLSTYVSGRQLDDDGNVLLRMQGGAKGVISASQIAVGCENDFAIRVYGERGGLEWRQSDANSLYVRRLHQPLQILRTAGFDLSAAALSVSTLPAGHPEGFLQAFAQLYRQFYAVLLDAAEIDYPGVHEGVRGMRFIQAVVRSSQQGSVWCDV